MVLPMSPIELKLIPLRCKGGGLKFSASLARAALILEGFTYQLKSPIGLEPRGP